MMKKNISLYALNEAVLVLCSLFMLAGCASDDTTLDIAGMFSSNGEPVNTRFDQSIAYNATQPEIHLDMGSDTYTVYACSDSHATRQAHKNLDYFIEQYNAAPEPKLALHLGDLIDAQKNFACADSILNLANSHLFIAVGNHDLYFKQWSIYRDYFKTATYWFDTNNGGKKLDLFICLDSGDGTLGAKQTKWLRELLEQKSKEGYRRIIVFTHTHFWKLDDSQGHTSNFGLEETYELASLFAQYGVEWVWSGHQHSRQSVIFRGVNYLVLDATQDKEKGQSYMMVDMGESAIYHYINYPSVASKE